MKVELEYCGKKVPVECADDKVLDVIHPADLGMPEVDIGSEITGPAREFLKGKGDNIVFIINDHTRPTPNDSVIAPLLPLLEGKDVTFILALGSHPAPDDAGLANVFGDVFGKVKDRIVLHDCRGDLVDLGTTSRGTPVKINRMAAEADAIITINALESHYFAGFSGGRKSILPGVSSYETIEANHKLALQDGSFDTALSGNPVHEDMTEAAGLLDKPVFSIQLVFDGAHRVISVEYGDLFRSFDRAVPLARKVACAKIKEAADIVVAVAPNPKDVNFYQAQQALEKGKLALRDGGIIILVAECAKGVGNDKFYKLLSSSSDPDEVLDMISREYKLGYHKAARIADLAKKAKIFLVSKMEPEVAENCFMTPYTDPQKALDDALAIDPSGRVTFLLDGFLTVPTLA
ncbi:nickel-dependent lactate racemase [Candidatus Altiarchaeota archaeon]